MQPELDFGKGYTALTPSPKGLWLQMSSSQPAVYLGAISASHHTLLPWHQGSAMSTSQEAAGPQLCSIKGRYCFLPKKACTKGKRGRKIIHVPSELPKYLTGNAEYLSLMALPLLLNTCKATHRKKSPNNAETETVHSASPRRRCFRLNH